jgi:hypothetical protein
MFYDCKIGNLGGLGQIWGGGGEKFMVGGIKLVELSVASPRHPFRRKHFKN